MTNTFLNQFYQFVKDQPNKVAFSFLDNLGEVTTSYTYLELWSASLSLAYKLIHDHKLKKGDRVLLVYPPSLFFHVAFIACAMTGIVSVPVFPPDPFHDKKDLIVFKSILESSGASFALTCEEYKNALQLADLKRVLLTGEKSLSSLIPWIVTDSKDQSNSVYSIEWDNFQENDLVFLQYTSGSTSEPKGVMIAQQNLYHNLTLIITGLNASDETIVVSWLPQYHDMGLIGSYLGVLFCGGSGFYFSPLLFIKNPPLWIFAMSKYHATHVQAPSFAYSLTAKKFLNLPKTYHKLDFSTIDLTSLKHMINAAEPVDPKALELFESTFQPYGLRPGVIFPTYGLAEHTVYVCSNGKSKITILKDDLALGKVTFPSKSTEKKVKREGKEKEKEKKVDSLITLVGCGFPKDSQGLILRIVDPQERRLLNEGEIGEIWIDSPSKAKGYWSLAEKSLEDFNAKLLIQENDPSAPSFLRTGDLGFLYNNELYICGRLKDTIIIRGKNHYPQDLEKTAESFVFEKIPIELRKGCSAAFSINISGAEVVGLIAELTDDSMSQLLNDSEAKLEAFTLALISELTTLHGVPLAYVAFIPPRTIPKTSSGKIARQWVKKAYLEGNLTNLYVWSHLDAFLQDPDELNIAKTTRTSIEGSYDTKGRFDPIGQPLDLIINDLKSIISKISGHDPVHIDETVPLIRLGLDSMQAIQVQASLDQTYSIELPEELLFDPDVTLLTLATSLQSGGKVPNRPILIEGYKVFEEMIKTHSIEYLDGTMRAVWVLGSRLLNIFSSQSKKGEANKLFPPLWFRENQIKAHIDTGKFEDGIACKVMPMSIWQDFSYLLIAFQLFGVFVWLPILFALVLLYLPLKFAIAFFVLFFSFVYIPSYDEWPTAFRFHWSFDLVLRYFSYRIIMEAPSSSYSGITSIYAFGPHGVFGIGPTIQAMINEFVAGENMHFLGADVIFKVPIYNIILQMLSFKPVDRKSFVECLTKKHSVGIIPGGIAEMFVTSATEEAMVVQNRKGFIKIALEHGAQIVPCYCFGNSITFTPGMTKWLRSLSRMLRMSLIFFFGRWNLPIPHRAPLFTVLGKPIVLPKVENPSLELVNEYHELYLRETRRIYETYKNAYNWHDRNLIFKR